MKIVSYAKEFFRKGKNCFCFKARVAAVDLKGEGVGHLFIGFCVPVPFMNGYLSTFLGEICDFFGKKFGGVGKSSYICSVRDGLTLRDPLSFQPSLPLGFFYVDYLIPLDAIY